MGCTGLTEIVIPDTVTSIGEYAFSNCSGLTSIVIGNSVEWIEAYAFRGCSSLTSIVIPNSVTSICEKAFSNCSGLTSIGIGNSVKYIGPYAFEKCSSLTSIVIPASVTKPIGTEYPGYYFNDFYTLFEGCTSLNSIRVAEGNPLYDSRDNCNAIIDTERNVLVLGCKTTTIPKSVTRIYKWAYSKEITSIVIPEWITYVYPKAFRGCPNLTSVRVAEGNTVLDSRNDCNAIIETESNTLLCGFPMTIIPDSVIYIEKAAFYVCRGMNSVTIPDKVKEIGDDAFKGCPDLKSVIIGKSVKYIGSGAFDGLYNLETITFKGKVKEVSRKTISSRDKLKTIYVLSKYKDYYADSLGRWPLDELIVELPEEKKKK